MFSEIKNRDAWSTLRGFVYQVDTTILRWLSLKDNEILELEKGEDIDIITQDFEKNEVSRELEQIKYKELNITLNQELSIEMLFNFFLHRNNNPYQKIYFRFVTNTNYGIERPALFPDGKSGIEVWTELRNSNSINKNDKRFLVIKSHLQKKLNENIRDESELKSSDEIGNQNNWKDFIAHIENDDNLIEFISDFEWSFGNEDYNNISETIKRKLIDSEIDAEPNKVDLLYSRLFLFVFKLLCNKTLKAIDKNDLQKQTSFPELNSSDQNILSLINNLLLNLNKRVAELEEAVSLNRLQIATLINDVELISDSDAIFDFKLRSIPVKPPSFIKNGTLRKGKVSDILTIFKEYNWVNFQGINGTGKSQLASLICAEFNSCWWLDLRTYNQDVEKTTLLVEEFLSIISHCPVINNRNIWVKEVLKSFSEKTLIVFNDMPRVEKNSILGELLTKLTNKKDNENVSLLTTSNFKIPSNLIQSIEDKILFEYYDFEFTDEEIIEYVVNQGANESIAKYINLIGTISKRNPRLISAVIYRLKAINWGQDSDDVFDIIFNKEFSFEILEDAQLSINQFIRDDKSRELLYRLSLIHWDFKTREYRAISEVEEKIIHPNEKLQDLLNIWIQEQNGSYHVSPLIYDIGESNLPQEVIENVHLAVAKSIVSTKKLDQISAFRSITSFINGKDYNNAGVILLNIYQSVKSKEEINFLASWGFLNFWSELDIPNDMSVVLRAYIRKEQIRLNHTIGHVTASYYDRLEEYAVEDSLSMSERLLVHFIILLDLEILNLSNYWYHLDFVLKNWKVIYTPFKEVISSDMFSGLLWFPIQYLVKEKDISLWLKYIETLESEFDIVFFDSDHAQTAIALICNKIVNSENQNKEKDWELVVSKLEILIEYFKNRKLEQLEIVALKEVIVLEYTILGNQPKAEEITTSTVLRISSNDAKYLLYQNYGKLCYNDKQIEKSQTWLLNAIKTDCTLQLDFIDTLIYGAASISLEDSNMAVKFCEKAIGLASNREDYLELDYIQILGELAIAYWLDGDLPKSFETFEDTVNRLLIIKEEEKNSYWIRLHMWCGHSLGYISALVSKDRVPEFVSDGGEYTKPYQGIFAFNTKDLSDLFQEYNVPLMLAHLAMFSDGINNVQQSYHWALRAFDLARKNGNQKIFLMVSGICSQYSLINFKVEETFESYLLFSAVSSHLVGDSPRKRYASLDKVNLSEIYSNKPSDKWNSAEDSTVYFAIIPLYIIVLNSYMKNSDNRIEYGKSFKNMLHNYIPKASNKELWEAVLELSVRILEGNISERELLDKGNTYDRLEQKNLQLICVLGIIFSSDADEKQLTQILNIFPYFAKIYSSSKSIIKFVLAPFVKNICLNTLKENFVGSRMEYDELVNRIESVDIADKNVLQLIIQPIVNELDISVIDNRRPWLYEYKEI